MKTVFEYLLTAACAVLIALSAANNGLAQDIELVSGNIAAGGGFADDGVRFKLVSSIGQLDAGEASGGPFTMTGGFLPEPDEEDDVLLGDVNQDGVVNLLDVAPFVDLITNGEFQAEGDINQDGSVNLLDVAGFVDLLTG